MANSSFSKQKPHRHGQPNQHLSSGLRGYLDASMYEVSSLMITLSGPFFLLSVFLLKNRVAYGSCAV